MFMTNIWNHKLDKTLVNTMANGKFGGTEQIKNDTNKVWWS